MVVKIADKNRMPKNFILVLRILVGFLFIFSGLIKLNDPLGFSYKLEEYFEVFGLDIFSHLSLFFSIFFCSLEVILGFALLVGFQAKWVLISLLGLILFFTFLTFYSAYFNKVTECGCFGDAIKLTPWQSFYKNLVLTSSILALWFQKKEIKAIWSSSISILVNGVIGILTLGFGAYCYRYLPVLDFLPYKIGKSIPAQMEIPKGQVGDEFAIEYTLKNRKTGEFKLINSIEYIKTKIYENPEWIYIKASDPILIKAGYQVPIKDLKIKDEKENDYTQEILNNSNYNLLIVEYDLRNTEFEAQKEIKSLVNHLQERSIKSFGLTATLPSEAQKLLSPYAINYPIFYSDAVPLKSMVRSNPGIILLKNGVVLGKWSAHNVPAIQDILKLVHP